jgi:Na+/H+ antiporter NhaC
MESEHFGILTLIPVIAFLSFALITRKTITAILISGILGYIIFYQAGFIQPTLDGLIDATTDWDTNYIVVICLLFGCLVQLLRESKGALAIGTMARKYVNSEKKALMLTWLCGVIIFVDDYLSILVTANTVMPLTDEHKTPREMLTYVVNTTSAPVCVIIPISAWVVYFSGVFEKQPEAAFLGADGAHIYYSSMPYFFYPFLCVIFVPLVILGVIPKMGGMKKAYERVRETGKLWPPSSDMMNTDERGEAIGAMSSNAEKADDGNEARPQLWAFIVPMAVVICLTIWKQDILWGVVGGILVCLATFLPTRLMGFGKFLNCCYKGLEDMLFISVVLITSLFYRQAIVLIGLPDYIIDVAGPYMNAAMLPAVAFIVIGLICFATSNIWSIPAVTTPIVVPLAASLGASIPLTLGAVISAAVFGAQACFYSDVTLMSSSACRINNVDYGIAQLPYIGIVTVISFIGYVIAGFALS